MRALPRKEDIHRVRVILPPAHFARMEGLYEFRHEDIKFYVDIIDALKELDDLIPGRGEHLLDRLQNFRTIFINTATQEVTT